MLKIESLCVKRGKNIILKDISINVGKGEIVGIVGPNGAGKSTLIKACAGVVKKTKGKIECNGFSIDDNMEKYLDNFQFCYDKAPFYPQLSGKENIMQTARIYNISKEDIKEALELVGLDKRKNDKISKYSFGMKQRLNIAQMILTKRPFVILDEPLNGIDPEGVALFREIFKKMKDEFKCSMIISSHLLGELKYVCDRIIFIKSGEIVEDINMAEQSNSMHIITVNDADKVLSILNVTGNLSKISEKKITIEADENEFNRCLSIIVKAGITILNIESYNNVERIYINKVGGELDD